MKTIEQKDWVWMPHAAHFICGDRCRFRLATKIGDYIVSTVGEIVDDVNATEFEGIGCNRLYETMVFPAKKSDRKCCPWYAVVEDGELDFEGYNDAGDAYEGHLKLCEKWSKK